MENKLFIRNKLWRVPLISLATGIASTLISKISIFIISAGTSEFTDGTANLLFGIEVAVALLLFIIAGIFCFKDMTKKETLKSSILICVYYAAALLLEQQFLADGSFPTISAILFLPVDVYNTLWTVLLRITASNSLFLVIPCILVPLLYIVFGRTVPPIQKKQTKGSAL